MKRYLALDLVLLPSNTISDRIIEINQKMKSTRLHLSKKETVPHLSLNMVRVEEEQCLKLSSKLKDYLEVLDLEDISTLMIKSLYQHNTNTVGWNIELTSTLKNLHLATGQLMRKYHFDKMSLDDNHDFAVVHPQMPLSGIDYLNDFYENYAYENFNPHITIGQGSEEDCKDDIGKEIEFKSIALFQMGTGCTCEKKLWEINISNIK